MGRCVLMAGLFLMCNRGASANILVNGDFEGSTYSETFSGYTDNLPTGWTNSAPTSMSNLNVFTNGSGPDAAESGSNYIAFQSAESDGSQDCLNQVIPTITDQEYDVTFWVGMTASPGMQFGLSPEWDAGGTNDTTMGTDAFYYRPDDSPTEQYTFFSFIETASGTSTSIYFHGADATGAVLLDNVSVTEVPEPAPLGLLALGALGLFAPWRRNRDSRG